MNINKSWLTGRFKEKQYIGKIVNKQNINKLTFVLPNASKDMLPMALCRPVHGDMLFLDLECSIGDFCPS